MAIKQIGWVNVQRVGWKEDYNFHNNIRVYASEKIALRYSHGLPVVPCFIEVNEEIVLDKIE